MATNFDWLDLDDDMGDAGLPGTGVTEAELLAIQTALADIQAQLPAADVTTELSDWSTTAPTDGQFAIYNGTTEEWTPTTRPTITVPFGIAAIGGNESSDPEVGRQGVVVVNFDCTITGWRVDNRLAGSVEWDIWVGGVSITGTAKPKTTSAITASSPATLTGWTTSVSSGTPLEIMVNSASGTKISSFNLFLKREI